MSLLHVENLCVDLKTYRGAVRVVDNFSLVVEPGEILGIVGESGSGKSMMSLALLSLLDEQAEVSCDYLKVAGRDLSKCSTEQRRQFISRHASIIFQEPQTSLNPCYTIGYQLDEVLRQEGLRSATRKKRAIELLEVVGIPQPETRLKIYPHQLSGGMNQRVMIAMAIAAKPKLLFADEPTTALDVTIQHQILKVLLDLNELQEMSLVLITHDFGLLAESTDRVGVMYCGQIIEQGKTPDLLRHPRHPYTRALLDSIPGHRHEPGERLFALRGTTPAMHSLPVGCNLGPRCPKAAKQCVIEPRLTRDDPQPVRCHFPLKEGEQLSKSD